MAIEEQILHVFIGELPMGLLRRGRGGKLKFTYDTDYLELDGGVPLSLSMPMIQQEYTEEKISPWLWGLLPDNELILRRWAQRFHISPRNCFALLEAMGEDCAGAIRFISPSKLDNFQQGGRVLLTEEQIEDRLADLRMDPSLGREPEDRGQFSLAGAQAKTALQRNGSKWYIPWGNEATTHILKPPRADLAGHVENEHYCLRLAAELGISAARSEVLRFGKELAIAIERYDRTRHNRKWIRVHQEDMCQTLSIHPSLKYQNEGGPGIVSIMGHLNRSSRPVEDRRRFMQAIVFNYLIVGTDAHAKNYSLLLGHFNQVRLARLYDVASLLPYMKRRKDSRFAMEIDKYYLDNQIRPRHFERMAKACEFPVGELRGLLSEMAARLPEKAKQIATELRTAGVRHPVIPSMREALSKRADAVEKQFS